MSLSKLHAVSSEEFGRRARLARAAAELQRAHLNQPRATAAELAREMEQLISETVSDRDVAKWLRGAAVPGSLSRIWALAAVLGVDAGWLAFESAAAVSHAGVEKAAAPPRMVERDSERITAAERPKRKRRSA